MCRCMCLFICLEYRYLEARREHWIPWSLNYRWLGAQQADYYYHQKSTQRDTHKYKEKRNPNNFTEEQHWSLVNCPKHKQYKKLESCTDLKRVQEKKKGTGQVYSCRSPSIHLKGTRAFYVWHMNSMMWICHDNSNKV